MTQGYVGAGGQWIEAPTMPGGPSAGLPSLATAVEIFNSNQVVTRTSVNGAGDADKAALHTFTLPGGILGPNGTLICEFEASSVDAGTRNLSLNYLVGSTITALSVEVSMATTNTHYQQTLAVYNTAVDAQKYRGSLQRNGASAAGFSTAAMDTAVDQQLVLAGRWLSATSGGTIRCEAIRVLAIYGA